MPYNEFPDEYIERVFYAWYENDRKGGSGFISTMPETEDGRKPARITVDKWMREKGWIERADALDAEVSRKMDDEIINKRMEMFKKHEQIGSDLIEKGMAFLNDKEKGITNDSTAVRAVDLGITTQRVSTGMAEAYVKISKMSDEALNKELSRLIGKKDDIVDAEFIEEE
jgi:hypothetical protein